MNRTSTGRSAPILVAATIALMIGTAFAEIRLPHVHGPSIPEGSNGQNVDVVLGLSYLES